MRLHHASVKRATLAACSTENFIQGYLPGFSIDVRQGSGLFNQLLSSRYWMDHVDQLIPEHVVFCERTIVSAILALMLQVLICTLPNDLRVAEMSNEHFEWQLTENLFV